MIGEKTTELRERDLRIAVLGEQLRIAAHKRFGVRISAMADSARDNRFGWEHASPAKDRRSGDPRPDRQGASRRGPNRHVAAYLLQRVRSG